MTCKDCVHYDLCRSCSRIQLGWHGNSVRYAENIEEICKDFKDSSRFVELPCKAGEFLYQPHRNQISKYRIKDLKIEWSNFVFIEWEIIEGIACPIHGVDSSEVGNTVFLTRKEAEQALKERET